MQKRADNFSPQQFSILEHFSKWCWKRYIFCVEQTRMFCSYQTNLDKKRMNLIFALKTLTGSCCMLLSYELWVSLPMKLGTGEIKRKRRWVLPGVSWLSKHCHKKKNSLQTSSKVVRLLKKESLFPVMSPGYDGMGPWEGWWSLPVKGLQSVHSSLLTFSIL